MISVIMLTYNREQFVAGMIEDVLGQTYSDFELIIVDNGSTDKSGEIVDQYAKKDPRIKCIHLSKAESIGKGRNIGLQKAGGEFVTYVDDDDHVEKDFLEFLYELITSCDADISMCGATELLNGKIAPQCMYEEKIVLSAQESVERLLERKYIRAGMPTKLIRREILCKYPFLEDVRHEDIHTVYKYFVSAKRVVLYGIPKYCFIRHGDNISYFTSDASRITPFQLNEYINAFRQRTIFLEEKMPMLTKLALYSEWSYMLSMCDKILKYNLQTCKQELNNMRTILLAEYQTFLNSEYIKEYEKENMFDLLMNENYKSFMND